MLNGYLNRIEHWEQRKGRLAPGAIIEQKVFKKTHQTNRRGKYTDSKIFDYPKEERSINVQITTSGRIWQRSKA